MHKQILTFISFLVLAPLGAWGVVHVRQVMRPERFTRGDTNYRRLQPIDEAKWIWVGEAEKGHGLGDGSIEAVRFSKRFTARSEPLKFDISADERFVLFLDGKEITRGPHKGMVSHWYYQSYEITDLERGDHVLTAVVYCMGSGRPTGVLTRGQGGFIFKAEGAYDILLTTGRATWIAERLLGTHLNGYGTSCTFGGSQQCVVKGTGLLDGNARGQVAPLKIVRGAIPKGNTGSLVNGWALYPTERPDQLHVWQTPGRFRAGRFGALDSTNAWYTAADGAFAMLTEFNDFLSNNVSAITIPAGQEIRLAWDLGDYYCGYPEIAISGGEGAVVRWGWAESLYDAKSERGNRDAFAGKRFEHTLCDTFLCDGRELAIFTAPWWRSGRWCEIEIKTSSAPLKIERLGFEEVRYPLEKKASFACDDTTLNGVWQICARGLENCMHETYMDCPYFEQQMYPGDTRIVMLITDALSGDSRLNRFAAGLFDYARDEDGLVPMNFPSRTNQRSATYSMCWVMMLGDYVRWQGADAWLKARLPGMRHTLHALAQCENAEGLVSNLPGWSFMDWVEAWKSYGTAPNGESGVSALNNLLYVYALQEAARVERDSGDMQLANYWEGKKRRTQSAVWKHFFVPQRGLLADDPAKTCFSEHAQCLALLTGGVPPEFEMRLVNQLFSAPDLARTTVYFSHYLFDIYQKYGRMDLFLKRLDLWRDYVKMGLKTPLEAPGRFARSDCHAWGSHPIYHLLTGVAGMRPAADGFAALEIAPFPSHLKHIRATLPTPKGVAAVDLNFAGERISGHITIPQGLPTTFVWKDEKWDVRGGMIESEKVHVKIVLGGDLSKF